MSPEVMARMNIPGVRDIFRDARATRNLAPLSDAAARPSVASQNRSGWREASPLSPPAGINHIDRMMDHQDAKDRAALIVEEGRRIASDKK